MRYNKSSVLGSTFTLQKTSVMKKKFYLPVLSLILFSAAGNAQDLKPKDVPAVVKTALATKYAAAKNVSWEKEKGNYEANWGGKSGEDHSVMFTPAGNFVEIVDAMPVSQLMPAIAKYVKEHYNGAKIAEAGKVTDAAGKTMYEAEVNGKDLVFDEQGKFLKKD
jgi:hypothetical protein